MGAAWTVVDALSDDEHRDVDRLVADVARRRSDEPLTETAQEHLDAGRDLRHALRRDGHGALTGYAVLHGRAPVTAEPLLSTYDDGLATVLEALDEPVSLLLREADPLAESTLATRGWRESRALHRLRRALPADPPPATDLTVRAFVPGLDEAAWVQQNNAAFAGHPTQGDMTVERLLARERSAWFDPSGFLLFLDGTELVASCWTKVHRCDAGDVGEIYVISVAPSAQGRGLGRLAVLCGLDVLHRQGLSEAELFVEEDNAGAYALYVALGFTFASRVVEYRLG